VSGSEDSLDHRYSLALGQYLASPTEEARHAAYSLGRMAAAHGVGVVDITRLHNETMQRVITAPGAAATAAMIGSAYQFLAECLAPYEMMLSAYTESNARLAESIDRLRETQAILEAVNQDLEAFNFSVAHDLRAPLRSILGFSMALLEDHADHLNDEARRFLGHVGEAAREMALLIDDLLTLSRATRGDPEREQVDITKLALEVIGRLAAGHPERRVEFAVEPGLMAHCDGRLLAIVLENLIGNAWKFTSRQSEATIVIGRVEEHGQPAYFVRDNGAGFDVAQADRLFGVFQRLHNAAEFEGNGIGLATVRRVINRHGGRVWGKGMVGKGATFYFTLGEVETKNGDERPPDGVQSRQEKQHSPGEGAINPQVALSPGEPSCEGSSC